MSDADAFLRTILKQPDNAAAPLVFADWLEEEGGGDNQIWAAYIRQRDSLARLEEGDPDRRQTERYVRQLGRRVRYRVRLHASHFLPHAEALLHLLPAHQWTLDLGGLDLPPTTVEILPESVARENQVLPVGVLPAGILLATYDPFSIPLSNRLSFRLTRDVLLVHSPAGQVREAIDRHYVGLETEVVDCTVYDFTILELPLAEPGRA